MKILLVGEYSRLHNSLKEGLAALGHTATIVGTGDDFKKYPVDRVCNRQLVHQEIEKCRVPLYRPRP
jgi:hypothetical protein